MISAYRQNFRLVYFAILPVTYMAFEFIKALSDGFNVCVEIFPVFIVYILL